MEKVNKFFVGLFEVLIGLIFLGVIFIVGGWLLMVALYKGAVFVSNTDWWQGIIATHGHIVALVFFGIAFCVYSVIHCAIFRN